MSEKGTDWLVRNARALDVERQRDEQTESWTRAKGASSADIESRDEPSRFSIELPDGSKHETLLVKGTDETRWGACDCQGYGGHTEACAHLCALSQLGALDKIAIPTGDELVATIKDRGPDDADANEGADTPQGVMDQTLEDATADADVDVVDTDAGSELEAAAEADSNALEDADQFAGSLADDVPDRYVMTLDGDPYIRREGYAVLAHRQGLSIESEIITWASDTDFEAAEARAVVTDPDTGRTWTGTGTAFLEEEDLAGAAAQLNELAETRAITRALSWATGAGMSANEYEAIDERESPAAARADGAGER